MRGASVAGRTSVDRMAGVTGSAGVPELARAVCPTQAAGPRSGSLRTITGTSGRGAISATSSST